MSLIKSSKNAGVLSSPDSVRSYCWEICNKTIYDEVFAVMNGKKTEKNSFTTEQIREAGKFAYSYIRNYRFLREIDTENRSELHLFTKWQETDPDIIEFPMPNGETKSLEIKSENVFVIDKTNKKLSCSGIKSFKLLRTHPWYMIGIIKNATRGMLELYLHSKFCDGNYRPDVDSNKKIAIETKKAFCTKFGHSIPVLNRIIGGKLWKRLDPEVAKLTLKIRGWNADNNDYTLIWNNLDEVKDTLNKAPGILPLWLIYAKNISDGVVFKNIIKNVKLLLEEHGITNQGWKYLIQLKPQVVEKLKHQIPDTQFNNIANAINLMATSGVVPRYTLLKNLSAFLNSSIDSTIKPTFIRALHEKTKKAKGIKNFWSNEAYLVIDWLNHQELNLDKNQMKAPWSWFMKKQVEWHKDIQRNERAKVNSKKWDSKVQETEINGYQITPLTSSLDLYDEGKEMEHCVSTYDEKCYTGKSRIFSVTKESKKIATFEIKKQFLGGWGVEQCRGKHNESVSEEIKKIAQDIAVCYNREDKSSFVEWIQ